MNKELAKQIFVTTFAQIAVENENVVGNQKGKWTI